MVDGWLGFQIDVAASRQIAQGREMEGAWKAVLFVDVMEWSCIHLGGRCSHSCIAVAGMVSGIWIGRTIPDPV